MIHNTTQLIIIHEIRKFIRYPIAIGVPNYVIYVHGLHVKKLQRSIYTKTINNRHKNTFIRNM